MPAVVLGRVQGAVREPDQGVHVGGVVGQASTTERPGDGDPGTDMQPDRDLGHGPSAPLSDLQHSLPIRVGQDDHELLPAVAGEHVAVAHRRRNRAAASASTASPL